MDKIIQFLKDRRLELGLTLDDVAAIVGVNNSTVSRWESGDIQNMKRNYIVKYAEALRISPGVIMGWDEPPALELSETETKIIKQLRAIDAESREAFIKRLSAYYEIFRKFENAKNEI